MSKGTKALIVVLIILAVLAAVIIAGSIVAGNMAEEMLGAELESMIVNSGFDDKISYSEIEIDLLRGEVKFINAFFNDPEAEADIQADEVFIRISPAEAVGFIRDPENAALSKVSAGLKGIELSSGAGSEKIEAGDLNLEAEGQFSSSTIDGELRVNDIDDELRDLAGKYFMDIGIIIPENGSFTVELKELFQ